MKQSWKIIAFLGFALCVSGPSSLADSKVKKPAAAQAIHIGEESFQGKKHIVATMDFHHPAKHLWAVLKRYRNYSTLLPLVRKAHVKGQLKKDKTLLWIESDAKFPFPALKVLLLIGVSSNDLTWQLKKGNVKATTGKVWTEKAQNGHENSQILRMRFYLDLGTFWPQSIVTRFAKKYLPIALRRIANQATLEHRDALRRARKENTLSQKAAEKVVEDAVSKKNPMISKAQKPDPPQPTPAADKDSAQDKTSPSFKSAPKKDAPDVR